MKFSEKWLRQWVDPPVGTDELVNQLTTAGLDVDSAGPVARGVEGVIVGRLLEVRSHPNADRLTVCRVDTGSGEPVEVVCGAPNVRPGLLSPYAPAGVRLADGKKLRASKIRGVQSNGMLCSPIEIGLGEDADAIMDLAEDAVPGTSLSDYLGLDDVSIDIELTPNRGDCLGLIGIAREVGVINRCAVATVEIPAVEAAISDDFPVVLESPAECPRYVGRVVRGIDLSARTPLWMTERLRRSGVRSIAPVVDVTNYVMLELGQPLHAFDLDSLDECIRVRKAVQGEALTLLDGQALTLDSEMLVIADRSRAVALAGIMGGAETGVTESTRNIFLESAFFEPRHVAGDARRYGLHTDASHRFERGVDPFNQRRAVERATALLLEIVGGEPGPVIETVSEGHLPTREVVTLRRSRIERLLGVAIDDAAVTDTLRRLGMEVACAQDAWEVIAPGFRFDIALEADLIEEIARITGYDELPTHRPVAELTTAPRQESTVALSQLRQVLVHRGYREAVTYSFVDQALQSMLDPDSSQVALANPISSDMAVMRTTLWPGLVQAMLYNTNRQQPGVRLFECGLVFKRRAEALMQEPAIAGIATGSALPRQWGSEDRDADFFDMKSDVESLLAQGGNRASFEFSPTTHAAFHPGQAAAIEREGTQIGYLGMVHPRVTRSLKYPGRVLAFELRLSAIAEGIVPQFRALSKFPVVRRDISIVVDESVSTKSVRDCVGHSAIHVLENLELFDVYQGEGIDSGKKSLGLSLTFQASSRTLNDEEVDSLEANILDVLGTKLGAVLRG